MARWGREGGGALPRETNTIKRCRVGFELMDGWMDGCMVVCMDGWMDVWMDVWTDGCMYGCMYG